MYELLIAVPRDVPLTIEADSQYVIQVFTEWIGGWQAAGWRTAAKKPVANQAAIKLLQPLLDGRDVKWVHVRGHRGHRLNEIADSRARAAAEAVKAGRSVETSGPHPLSDYLDLWRRGNQP